MVLTPFVGVLRSNKLLWVPDCIIQPVEARVTRHKGNWTMKSTSTAATAPRGNGGETGTDFAPGAISEICESLRVLLADAFIARKTGGTTLRSIADIVRRLRLARQQKPGARPSQGYAVGTAARQPAVYPFPSDGACGLRSTS